MKNITFTDEPNAVTIRITGEAFKNLAKIAEIFNAWDKADNTPADIVGRFACFGDHWRSLYRKETTPYETGLAGLMCDCFSHYEDMPELEAAFEREGFSTNR